MDYAAKITPSEEDGLSFGTIMINSGKTLDVTVKNTGANAFTPAASIAGTGFSTAFTGTELASGQTATIPVVFSPTAIGDYTGTLTVNCGNAGTFNLPLTGSSAYEKTVCDETSTSDYLPIYGYYYDEKQINQMIYPSSMLEDMVGKKIKSLTFYTSNEYFKDGKYNVSIGTTTQSDFATTPTRLTGLTLVASDLVAVAGAKEITITFDEPFVYSGNNLVIDFEVTTAGSYGSSRTYFYGANQESATSFHSYGSSINANGVYNTSANTRNFLPKVKFGLEDNDGPLTPVITANPTAVSGLEAMVGGTPATAMVTVTGANLTGDIAAAIVEENSPFSITPATIAQTDGAATGTITVTYTPTAAGTHTGTLRLTSADATSVDVALSGTATLPPTPTITTSVDALTINAFVGETATATFTVTGANLEGDITVAAGEGFTVSPATIAADDAANGVTVTVTYAPQAAGNATGTITLTSANAETVNVAVNATAVVPVVSGTVTPASLTFSCQEGQNTTGTITIENTGNRAFTPAFSGIEAPFSIEAATEVAAGSSTAFTVTYAPEAVGTHTGTLTVTINGEATTVTLNGTALEAPEGGELTVAESTSTSDANLSSIAPIYGGKYNTTGRVQMLYPASLITDLVGKQITKVTFRHKGAVYFSGGTVEVSIGETENANLQSGLVDESTLTAVATVSPIGKAFNSEYYLTFEFTKPYVYNGGNLVIQTNVTTKGNEARSRFYGQTSSQLGLGNNLTTLATSYTAQSGNGYSTTFLPQATFTYETARGVVLVSPDNGVLNFDRVSVKGHKTLNVTVKNLNAVAVTPTFSELSYPYSVASAPASIGANEEGTIAITMAPNNDTESVEYNNVTFTMSFSDGGSLPITLNGTSHVNEPTMTTDDFAAIEYTWEDEEGTHTSNLAEVATEPAQMVALMREVYTNRNIPGNWYRGYTSAGVPDREVAYPAIGTIVYGTDGYDYADSYGWNIGFSDNVSEHIVANSLYPQYRYFNPDEYKPLKEGVTLLLVEMNDNNVHEDGTWDEVVASISNNKPATHEALCNLFGTVFKSVRVVTESRRMGAGEEAGTIFKLDADKLNRFFLLAKGRLRMFSLDVDRITGSFIDASSTSNGYRETEEMGPFYQMFEQLSPVDLGDVAEITDVYQDLVDMKTFVIEHDCQSIPFVSSSGVVGHEFNMYGKDSKTDDCQDVRDLMITIPERRMQWWSEGAGKSNNRDGVQTENDQNDMYQNYNKQYSPKMGLFVIKQYDIEGEKQENANVYDLHLSWTSNLLEFLPTGYGMYTLYRVVTNADGTKTYVKVTDNLDPNTYSYVDHIEMLETGQVVTYVVQGQDKEQFLSLQLSNEESFVIPGLDRAEQLRIELNSDYYYSRYDAATKTNNYSNSLIANNTVGTNVKANYLRVWQEGSDVGMFKFWRATLKTVDGQEVVDKENAVNFANCKVTAFDATTGGTLAYEAGDDQTDFSGKPYGAGYHANAATSTISIDENGNVVFDGLKLYDNFSVSVEDNTHPSVYVYYVTLQTAVPFNLNDEGTETSDMATSNTVSVPVYKTEMAMNPLTAQDVEDDVTHQIPASTDFNLQARYSGKSEILAYYIYRWADKKTAAEQRSIYEDDGADASPQGQAGNQGEYYTVAMNADYTDRTENFTMDAEGNHNDVTALFKDNFMVKEAQNGDTYTYAPVVELFAPAAAVNPTDNTDRKDYNTYGGPQQMTAGGVLKANVESMRSEYTWTANGKTYAYYNVFLDVNTLDLPEGYEVAKVRAWRKIAPQYLGEQEPGGKVPDYTHRLNLDVNGEYKFVDKEACQQGEALGNELVGSAGQHIYSGTFGALKLEAGEEIPMDFVVRVYFTKSASQGQGAPMLKAESNQPYYIAEYTVSDKLTSNVVTGIIGIDGAAHITGVKYYNAQGMESATPFQGVNIEVITYDDGTRSTRKVLR